ncbi:B3 domain-containing protein, DNA-binding pseudobarrel domain protein [Tanacetum coccineum]
MGNKNTHVANVAGPDQTNKRVHFSVSKYANGDVNEEEYYRVKLEELANKKLSAFDFEENDVLQEKKVKKATGREIVSNEVMTELREFIDEIKGSDMNFLTDEETWFLDRKADDAEIEVRLVWPNLQMFKKPMLLKIWNKRNNKNYVLKTNWCDFVEANKKVLKERETIQVWSFSKDEQLCFAVVRVEEPMVNRMTLEDASYDGGSSLIS